MKHTTCTLLLLLTALLGFSQGWEQFYGANSPLTRASDAIQLQDGDYLILCSGGTQFSIVRTNGQGIEKWRRALPAGTNSSTFFPLPSGNVALISSDYRILEIDTAANVIVSNPIETPFTFTPHMLRVSDGYVSIVHSSPNVLYMWKISFTGQHIWEKEVLISGIFPGGRGAVTPDGGFIFAGTTLGDVRLVKFDADGNILWTTVGGTPDNDGYNMAVKPTSDGGYAVVSDIAGINQNIRVFKFDGTGTMQWWGEHEPQTPFDQMGTYLHDFIETTDGGFAIAGRLTSGNSEYPMALKFSNNGGVDFFYPSPLFGRFNAILQTNDGGYHLVGQALNQLESFPVDRPYAVKLIASGAIYSNYVSGKITLDQDMDCIGAEADLPLRSWIVKATGGFTNFAATNQNGEYLIGIDTGTFTLEVIPPNNLWQPCDSPVTITAPGVGDTLSADFPVQAILDCPSMQVDIGVPFLRRCFTNTLNVQYCNLGTVPAQDAYIEVTLDDLLELESSTIPVSGQTGNTYTFSIGEVGINECGSFQIVALVSCETELGQTLCMEAHAFPDTICGTPFNWSGASMMARAYCQGDTTVVLELENIGTAPTSEAIDYIVIEDQIIFLQDSKVFEPLQVETFFQPANGATWRITSEQEPNHPGNSIPTAFVEGCGTNDVNTFSTGFVNEHPMADGDGYIDIDCEQVIGAYDPNDKMGLPKGYGAQHYIEPNTDLEYRIRFQNTGTDTAFTVVIRDTLSPFLDPASIKVGASSHNYEFDLEGDAVAIFRFDNILLPDSNVNEALSHGFVSFSISQKPDVALESVIENEAAIYFDFNDPVITNPVFHTIGINFIEVATDVNELPEGLGELLAYPNPSAGEVTFEIPTEQPVSATFVLYDSFGRLTMRKGFEGQRFLFNGNELPKGIYFYKVEVEGLGKYSGKVILK